MISVILPVRNEARVLESVLRSLLGQQARTFDLEILAIDGRSTDASRDIIARVAAGDPRVRLLDNPDVKTPFAFNLGLREARGGYVAVLGAHNEYDPDYLEVCLRELRERGAVACSGRTITIPASRSLTARIAAWVSGHPFASSTRSFRTQPEGYADTVPYPVMVRDAVLAAGGYDETLHRNQDNDLNQRLRAAGHRLYCTWKTVTRYHAQPSVRRLLAYAFRNGYWNVVSLRVNPSSMGLRHLVPFAFVAGLTGAAVLAAVGIATGRAWLAMFFVVPLALHLLAGAGAAVQIALRQRSMAGLLAAPVFLLFHLAYGAGSAWGFLTRARPGKDGNG